MTDTIQSGFALVATYSLNEGPLFGKGSLDVEKYLILKSRAFMGIEKETRDRMDFKKPRDLNQVLAPGPGDPAEIHLRSRRAVLRQKGGGGGGEEKDSGGEGGGQKDSGGEGGEGGRQKGEEGGGEGRGQKEGGGQGGGGSWKGYSARGDNGRGRRICSKKGGVWQEAIIGVEYLYSALT